MCSAKKFLLPQRDTAHAASAQSSLLIGSDEVDGLIGGIGDDDLIGGKGQDILLGDAGTDHLFGGDDNDLLDGGANGDYICGGAGSDTYTFSGGFGNDIIQNSGSAGLIKVDGTTLNGGKKVDDNVWESADGVYRYQLFSFGVGQDLVISRGSKALASDIQGSIVIKGWTGTGLGLTLDSAAPVVPPGIKNYNGDQHGALAGSAPKQYYNWGTTSWDEATGTLTNGIAEVSFADVIFASAVAGDNTVLHGNGGNDALAGSASKDEIFGDGGDDLIGGGAGSDNISGGAGNDYIFGSGSVTAPQRNSPNDTWPALGQPAVPANATIITQGKTWGVYTVPGQSGGSAMTILGISAGAQDAAPDIVDAGDGDDHVFARRGADYIEGGLGNDALYGGGGGDVIEGGDGINYIWGDGQISASSYSYSVEADHGSDFIDGGVGNDQLTGGGGNDEIYGGADDDQLHGDEAKEIYLDGSYHGNDDCCNQRSKHINKNSKLKPFHVGYGFFFLSIRIKQPKNTENGYFRCRFLTNTNPAHPLTHDRFTFCRPLNPVELRVSSV